MCPDERLAGLWMVSPVSLEPRLSLALWSFREAIFFFCPVKLSGSFLSCARFCLQKIFGVWICRVFSRPVLLWNSLLSTWTFCYLAFNCVDF
ncbi:hypothetical protein NPIL_438611 [Nephila pilipes]|uniref:Uncharacterized protein n=1 Tax=Nephila pilipes TaxID=299642 RepID=A0A8X6MDP0_NEPPI|nr:hypothetical protein NPIL_438611 [Nephila pilipes]